MTINDYKAALKNMIDATNDETILKQWKNRMEGEFEEYRQQRPDQSQQDSPAGSTPGKNRGKDDTSGYVILESGLGIDE